MDDLTPLLKEIEKLIQERMELSDLPGIVLLFTGEPDYQTVRYITNLKMDDAIKALDGNIKKLQAEFN